jgi:hypothetical protein
MKAILNTAAATAVLIGAAVGPATAAPSAQQATAGANCQPGMTAPTAGTCSLQGFHWASTIVYGHHHAQSQWMLLPDK